MNKRERLLVLVVLIMVGAFGIKWGYGKYSRSMEQSAGDLRTATEELRKTKIEVQRGLAALNLMNAWQQRSLPTDIEKARTLYSAWLLDQAKEAGLTAAEIRLTNATPSVGYKAIAYHLEAGGSLTALTKLLYAFYSSPLLQQITSLKLSPSGPAQLQISLDVEALCLPGATATDEMPEGKSNRLKLASIEEYEKSLDGRNLVSVYTPPRPPGDKQDVAKDAPPPPPKFDDAKHARVTAVVQAGPRLQAWIWVLTTGEMLRVYEGDPVKVGSVEAKVESISPQSVVLKTDDDKQIHVKIGRFLREDDEKAGEIATKG